MREMAKLWEVELRNRPSAIEVWREVKSLAPDDEEAALRSAGCRVSDRSARYFLHGGGGGGVVSSSRNDSVDTNSTPSLVSLSSRSGWSVITRLAFACLAPATSARSHSPGAN